MEPVALDTEWQTELHTPSTGLSLPLLPQPLGCNGC